MAAATNTIEPALERFSRISQAAISELVGQLFASLSKTSRLMLPGGAASAAGLLATCCTAQMANAQSNWSPEPFQNKAAIGHLRDSNNSSPSRLNNSLRNSFDAGRGQASAASDDQVVVRWGSVKQAHLSDATYSQSDFEPRSEVQAATVQSQDHRHSSQVEQVVWNDRTSSTRQGTVRPAHFQLPGSSSSAAQEDDLDLAPLFDDPVPPPRMNQDLGRERSLLRPPKGDESPETTLPSPFPRDNSPSDRSPPDQSNSRPPTPPPARATLYKDCDTVRSNLLGTPITSIALDVSPKFGTGPKDKKTARERRDDYTKDAPLRTWTDYKGYAITEGRLVDLRYDAVELESSSGAREGIYLRDLSDADLAYVSEVWGLPRSCSVAQADAPQRAYTQSTVTWTASGLCHKPLYFEDVQLERYGHEHGPVAAPLIASAHFFGNVLFLPYKMGIHPMNECQYALGFYRPGNCAPWTIAPVPLSLRGAVAETAVVVGAAAILP